MAGPPRTGVLLVHPTGNANVRAAAAALQQSGWLHSFHTSLGWTAFPGLPAPLQRRAYRLPARLLRVHPARELARLLAVRAGLSSLLRQETGLLCVDRVYAGIDRAAAAAVERLSRRAQGPQLVYAYEDGALACFRAARRHGLATAYELPIGYWRFARRLFREEAERRPTWAATLEGLADSPAKCARKDAELALAQHIVVPSGFVRRTLADHPGELAPVSVLPYGCPPPLPAPPERPEAGPLRVLFVGGLSQRKGVADLLEAADLLGSRIALTLIGRPLGEPCPTLQRALLQHRWLASLPHGSVLAEMRRHDVLVLPSLFEGFPLVIGEALAQGLPVIATVNAAADELIDHGREGFLVPIRDPAAIAAHLDQLAADRGLRQTMAEAALQRAGSWSWSDYARGLCALLQPLLA